MTNPKKKAMGRGLEAILASPETDITSKDISGNYVAGAIANLKLSKITANPFQPREEFGPEALAELADSIREQGIIQPLTVRKMGFDKYQLISGERRFKAAQMAGLETVPCFIRVANDEQMLEWALIENIQRENLNAMEIAISFNRLMEECKLTQEDLSKKVGKNRSTVTNYMRLLRLPASVQAALRDGSISMGHARALLGIDDAEQLVALTQQIIEKQLSVRDVEKMVAGEAKSATPRQKAAPETKPAKVNDLQQKLSSHLDRKVKISLKSNGKGSLTIPFRSEADLSAIALTLGISL